MALTSPFTRAAGLRTGARRRRARAAPTVARRSRHAAVARSRSSSSTSRPPARSAATDAITEIGALKLRGGELLGTFETLVNPGVPIPPMITVLTGITEAMLLPAPRIDEVLPALLEFVARRGDRRPQHPLRLRRSSTPRCVAHGYPRLANRRVDTVALARRLVRDEVPNLRLRTLARHFRTDVEPVHRAYRRRGRDRRGAARAARARRDVRRARARRPARAAEDARAPVGREARAHRAAAPPPGVYLFRDRDGRVLYVGKATNLRARVRSLLRDRRPPQGAATAAGDDVDRPPRVPRPVRGRGARAPADPARSSRASTGRRRSGGSTPT